MPAMPIGPRVRAILEKLSSFAGGSGLEIDELWVRFNSIPNKERISFETFKNWVYCNFSPSGEQLLALIEFIGLEVTSRKQKKNK